MRQATLIVLLLFISESFFGQTLVYYGNHRISRNEFLAAYRKNNPKGKTTAQAYREYLDLYIRYRLKVQAAYDGKLDTLPNQLIELQNFRSQIEDQYSNDESSLNRMAKEAFERSQKDIRLSVIFVATPKDAPPADTTKALKKINAAYADLRKGKSFEETAEAYSDDPFVKTNKGDLGYITVFDLPYEIETLAYRTPLGKYSAVSRTSGGYMILKKTAERPALGRMHAAQILLIFPYQANDAAKADTKKRADSIYQAIRSGSDFGELARKFSGDNLSYQLGGVMPEFGIGKYEGKFEEVAFGLSHDGDISKPFETAFGYHIVKRISRIPVPAKADQKTLDALKLRIQSDRRIEVSKKEMLQHVLKETGFKTEWKQNGQLFIYTDSMMQHRKAPAFPGLNAATVLYSFPDKKITVADWIAYRTSLARNAYLLNGKTNEDLLDQYRQTVAFDYYKAHLERYNKDFANQVNEFRDGNLLFEIMQRNIWNKASADSAGLKKYFDAHAARYQWQASADAIIFSAANIPAAKKIQEGFSENFAHWRSLVDSLGGQVQADSGRFELKQLPGKGTAEGQFSTFASNPDNTVRFAYIIHQYPNSAPRSFEDARGLVINDYQNQLEDEWIAELKKKYPVKIDEAVFKSMVKN
ncbi:MAG TPA: peptidylprolyl isomerase [Puia sp.]|nr:peptidylprolyl isomerase [Puia sp.]